MSTFSSQACIGSGTKKIDLDLGLLGKLIMQQPRGRLCFHRM